MPAKFMRNFKSYFPNIFPNTDIFPISIFIVFIGYNNDNIELLIFLSYLSILPGHFDFLISYNIYVMYLHIKIWIYNGFLSQRNMHFFHSRNFIL